MQNKVFFKNYKDNNGKSLQLEGEKIGGQIGKWDVPDKDEQREWLLSWQQRAPSRKALKRKVSLVRNTSTTRTRVLFPLQLQLQRR